MPQVKDHFIIGSREAVEAEYGYPCDKTFCVLEMHEGEVACSYGYSSKESARRSIGESISAGATFEYL